MPIYIPTSGITEKEKMSGNVWVSKSDDAEQ